MINVGTNYVVLGNSSTNGPSNGTTSCNYANTSSLAKGTYTLSCTAITGAGKSTTSTKIIAVVNSSYVLSTKNALIATAAERNYKKNDNTPALVAIYNWLDGSDWRGPLLVTPINASGAIYYTDGNYNHTETGYSTINYKGMQWYVSGTGAAFPTSIQFNTSYVTMYDKLYNKEEAAKKLIDMAMN